MPPIDLSRVLARDPEALDELAAAIEDWLAGNRPPPCTAAARRRYWMQQRSDALIDLAMLFPRSLSRFELAGAISDYIATPPAEIPTRAAAAIEKIHEAQSHLGGGELSGQNIYKILLGAAFQSFY